MKEIHKYGKFPQRKLLPIQILLAQATIWWYYSSGAMSGRPDINGEILTSLAEGTNVTMISQSGQWFEVEVNGRRRVTGYMHRSTVAAR